MTIRRSLVYFAFIGDEAVDDSLARRRFAFMDRQLQWLADVIRIVGDRIEVVVPYVAPRSLDAEVRYIVERRGFRLDSASLDADRRNMFEYPGFIALKALALRSAADDLIYYCHSKGIVHLDESKMGLFRLHTEVGLSADLARLANDPTLTRASLFPSRFGWCWYNMFWIKARHIAGLSVEPSTDRHHFEALIGTRGDREGYRGVLALIDRVPFADTGVTPKPWYRAEETVTDALFASYDRYAGMASPAASAILRRALADH